MSTRTILVPTDFSSASDASLPHAATLARQSGARLLIVHVEEPPMAYGGGELYYGLPEPDSARIAAMLEKVTPSDPAIAFTHPGTDTRAAHQAQQLRLRRRIRQVRARMPNELDEDRKSTRLNSSH